MASANKRVERVLEARYRGVREYPVRVARTVTGGLTTGSAIIPSCGLVAYWRSRSPATRYRGPPQNWQVLSWRVVKVRRSTVRPRQHASASGNLAR